MNVNEHLWSGIIHRSETGEVRKEDDITPKDFNTLSEVMADFAHAVAYYDEYTNTKISFHEFLTNQFVDWDNYKTVLNFIQKNWTEIEQKLDELVEEEEADRMELEECEGVPGGLTPADVSGMGDITFPGETGEKGSGDIPLPSKTVYTQVMPYSLFVKKKKKKKFRKEDEPCVHSDNSKIYDYVDDYRDYVDRTYDKIDGK